MKELRRGSRKEGKEGWRREGGREEGGGKSKRERE